MCQRLVQCVMYVRYGLQCVKKCVNCMYKFLHVHICVHFVSVYGMFAWMRLLIADVEVMMEFIRSHKTSSSVLRRLVIHI